MLLKKVLRPVVGVNRMAEAISNQLLQRRIDSSTREEDHRTGEVCDGGVHFLNRYQRLFSREECIRSQDSKALGGFDRCKEVVERSVNEASTRALFERHNAVAHLVRSDYLLFNVGPGHSSPTRYCRFRPE